MIKQRKALLQKENRTEQEERELKKLKRLVSKQIKEDLNEYNEKFVLETLSESGSIRKIKDSITEGKNWMTHLNYQGRDRISRKDILAAATDFYEELYNSENNDNNTDNYEENKRDMNAPPFLESEIKAAIFDLCDDKCADSQGIKAEYIKIADQPIIKQLTQLFNKIIHTNIFPKQWLNSSIVLIHKKGSKTDINNYRPISIISTIYKIFSKCIARRISKILDDNQPRSQAGFRSGYSTTDHLHTVNQLIEKSTEYNFTLYFALIDYKKAFNSIEHSSIWRALRN